MNHPNDDSWNRPIGCDVKYHKMFNLSLLITNWFSNDMVKTQSGLELVYIRDCARSIVIGQIKNNNNNNKQKNKTKGLVLQVRN